MKNQKEQPHKRAIQCAKRKRRLAKSDAMRLYAFILKHLQMQLPNLRLETRLTFAMMMTGLLRSRSGQLAKIVHHEESLVMRLRRFVKNDNLNVETCYLPLVTKILQAVSAEPIVLMVDTTKMGGQCLCLMVSVFYKKRALPLAWLTVKGKKGHLSQETQVSLFKQVKELLPPSAQVVLVGDAEFDGCAVITWLKSQTNWQYVFHTDETTLVGCQGVYHSLKEWTSLLQTKPEEDIFLTDVSFTEAHQVLGQNIMMTWHEGEKRYWFFVTNCPTLAKTRQWYQLRFTIETLFSDLKGRGFNLDDSRLWKPERLNRLILMAAWAYYFVVVLGVESLFTNLFRRLVRTNAFVHSLFQLGLIYLDHILNECLKFPDAIDLPPPDTVPHVVISP